MSWHGSSMDNHAMKRCYRCTEMKEADAFGVSQRAKDGLAQECKDCKRERSRAYRQQTRLRGMAATQTDEPKTCNRCREMKPRSDFGKSCSEKDGLRRQCLSCRHEEYQQAEEQNRARSRAWARANKERKRVYDQAYYESHGERLREQNMARYWADWERRRAVTTIYQKANREKINAQRKASPVLQAAIRRWNEANKEKRKAQRHEWYLANKERELRTAKAWRDAHPGYGAENVKRWKEKYPERAQTMFARIGAQRRGVMGDGSVTEAEWARILKFYGYRCAICHMPKTRRTPLHVDHYIPLTKGGAHNWLNVWPLCPPCNNSKYNRLPPGAPPHAIAFLLEAS